jgi:hypothetical protein
VDLWDLQAFRGGFAFGAVACGALLLVGFTAAVLRRRRSVPVAGVVTAAGGLWSISDTRPVPTEVVVGVLGIGAAAALACVPRVSLWHSLALTAPFAWAIGFRGDVVEVAWAQVLVAVTVSAGAILATAFDHAWRQEATGLTLLAITAFGMYAAVPDTETIAAALGVVLPFLLLGWPSRLARLGRPGAAAAVAVLVWAGAIGAEGRPTSIVGLVGCLGLLAAVPVAQFLLPRAGAKRRRWPRQAVILAMLTGHLLLVIAASRVVGRISDVIVAAAIGAVVVVAAVVVGANFRPAAPT